jgi:hypothetical protein
MLVSVSNVVSTLSRAAWSALAQPKKASIYPSCKEIAEITSTPFISSCAESRQLPRMAAKETRDDLSGRSDPTDMLRQKASPAPRPRKAGGQRIIIRQAPPRLFVTKSALRSTQATHACVPLSATGLSSTGCLTKPTLLAFIPAVPSPVIKTHLNQQQPLNHVPTTQHLPVVVAFPAYFEAGKRPRSSPVDHHQVAARPGKRRRTVTKDDSVHSPVYSEAGKRPRSSPVDHHLVVDRPGKRRRTATKDGSVHPVVTTKEVCQSRKRDRTDQDESLPTAKRQRLAPLPFSGPFLDPVRDHESIVEMSTRGKGVQDHIAEGYLKMLVQTAGAPGVTASSASIIPDIELFKKLVGNGANSKKALQDFIACNLQDSHVFGDDRLSLILVVEDMVEDGVLSNYHDSLLVVDRTRPGHEFVVYFDSEPLPDKDPMERIQNTFKDTRLDPKTIKWIFAQTPMQADDSCDCAAFTCGFALAYLRSLHSQSMLKTSCTDNVPVEHVVVRHSMTPEKLGAGIRAHIYESGIQGEMCLNEACLDMVVDFS